MESNPFRRRSMKRRALLGPAVGQLSVLPSLAFVLLLGCDGQQSEPDLAPRLLHDEAEMAVYLDAFPRSEYEIFEVPNVGRFWLDDNKATVKQRLRSGHPHSPHLIEIFAKHAVPGSTALDVGAHIGSLSVPLAGIVGPQGRVYAFEPQKKIFRELVHNLRLNELSQAVPLRFALSSKPGILEMEAAGEYDGRVKVGHGGDPVEARTLDSFGFSNVSLIKIDVEGFEAQVLKGAIRTIADWHPVLVLEIWPENRDTVLPLLRELGYSVQRVGRSNDYLATFAG